MPVANRHNASCQLFAEHLLPALLCNTVLNGSPVEPSILELFEQETLRARCLGTVCQRQLQNQLCDFSCRKARNMNALWRRLQSNAHPAKGARACERLLEGGAASVQTA
eukprot:SAG11_NODE_23642_length_385_cov_0.723776_1_plen_108_part_10